MSWRLCQVCVRTRKSSFEPIEGCLRLRSIDLRRHTVFSPIGGRFHFRFPSESWTASLPPYVHQLQSRWMWQLTVYQPRSLRTHVAMGGSEVCVGKAVVDGSDDVDLRGARLHTVQPRATIRFCSRSAELNYTQCVQPLGFGRLAHGCDLSVVAHVGKSNGATGPALLASDAVVRQRRLGRALVSQHLDLLRWKRSDVSRPKAHSARAQSQVKVLLRDKRPIIGSIGRVST